MAEFTSKSGAVVVVGIAPWREAKALKQAIELEAANAGIKIDLESDISTLVGALLKIDGSPLVDAVLWPCLARCTYNNEKITEALFDKVEPRGDYYEIVAACIRENLRPLVESLYFVLPPEIKAIVKLLQNGVPTSKSTTPPSSLPAD